MASRFAPLMLALVFLTCCYHGSCNSTTNSSPDPNETFLANNSRKGIPVHKIVNGDEAEKNEFPWRCYITSGKDENYLCGCSLIAERWVLTAAHCTLNWRTEWITVYLGSHVRAQPMIKGLLRLMPEVRDVKYEQRIVADYVINHPEFRNVMPVQNDIALIRLAQAPTLGPNVFPISLPFNIANEDLLGETAVTSGWGLTEESSRPTAILRKLTMEIMSNEKCSLVWPWNIPDNLICAMKYGSSACFGDSGGSLDIERNGTPFIIGVTSWFETGCGITRPTVFTKVTEHLQWIQNYIGQ